MATDSAVVEKATIDNTATQPVVNMVVEPTSQSVTTVPGTVQDGATTIPEPAAPLPPVAMEQASAGPAPQLPAESSVCVCQKTQEAKSTQCCCALAQCVADLQKPRRSKRHRTTVGMYPGANVMAQKEAATTKKKAEQMKQHISDVVADRMVQVGCPVSHLFTYEDFIVLNDMGDLRFWDCVLKSPVGPYPSGTCIKLIDWVFSASLLLVSPTAKMSDVSVLGISPVVLTPIPPQ